MKLLRSPKGAELSLTVDQLTRETTRRLMPGGSLADVPLVLNLAALRWIDPFGLIWLYVFCRHLKKFGPTKMTVRLPSGAAGYYLARMDFCEVIKGSGIATTNVPLFRRRDLPNRLIELSRRSVENEDEADELTEELIGLIFARRKLTPEEVERVRVAINELITNVSVHSGRKEVLVAAQTYGSQLQIAIGDEGIGIPTALRRHNIVGAMEDHQAIEKAMEAGVSTRLGKGGMGLYTLSDMAREGDLGRLSIRSGRGLIEVSEEKIARKGRCDPLPGTIVEAVV